MKNSFIDYWIKLSMTICILVLISSINSCNSFVDVELPTSQLNTKEVFEDKTSVHAAMTAIYAEIRDGGIVSDLSYNLGLYTDELDLYNISDTAIEEFYENRVVPSNRLTNNWWDGAYFLIYSANAIMESIENSTANLKEDKDQLRGEALFARALLHYNLSHIFGDIPFVSTTDHVINTQLSKLPEREILARVEIDLLEAISLLPPTYINQNRSRPNKFVAMALLSRVYLSNQNWTGAKDMATAVINQSNLYNWQDNLDLIFLKESSTTLWQWIPEFEGTNTSDGNRFIFTAGPPPQVALTQSLVSSFDPADLRLTHWIKEVSDGENSWFHPFKYKENSPTDPTREFPIFFRLAELYLIRSEARGKLDDLVGATADLNKIRTRAGLSKVKPKDKKSLMLFIIDERRHEFFTESGHRFFDLKRSHTLDESLTPFNAGWDTTGRLFPLPDKELLLNPNLEPQNPGY